MQLKRERKLGSQCPIKKIVKEHVCGSMGKMQEAQFRRENEVRTPKWVRYGLEGGIVKYMEDRNYTQEGAIQAHYIEVIEKPS